MATEAATKPIVLGCGANVTAVTLGVRDGKYLVAEKRCRCLPRDIRRFVGRMKVYDVIEEYDGKRKDDGPMVVMDLIPGGNLADILDSHFQVEPISRFTLLQRFKMAYDLAQQVEQMHEKRIIHRDLKTQNVMIDENFMCVLIDFDFGREWTAEDLKRRDFTMTYTVGTYIYNPPELQNRDAAIEFCARARSDTQDEDVLFQKWISKIDVYQFGMLLYEMFTGIVPFNDRTSDQAKLSEDIYNGTVRLDVNDARLIGKCPRSVLDLIDECVAYEADMRPSMTEVRESIRNAFQDDDDLVKDREEFFDFCDQVDGGAFDEPVCHGTLENLRKCAEMGIPWSKDLLKKVEEHHLGE